MYCSWPLVYVHGIFVGLWYIYMVFFVGLLVGIGVHVLVLFVKTKDKGPVWTVGSPPKKRLSNVLPHSHIQLPRQQLSSEALTTSSHYLVTEPFSVTSSFSGLVTRGVSSCLALTGREAQALQSTTELGEAEGARLDDDEANGCDGSDGESFDVKKRRGWGWGCHTCAHALYERDIDLLGLQTAQSHD